MGTKEDSATRERKALRYSLVVATALAVLAAFWGWISQSQVILLDGVYALIGMVLTAISLRVSRIRPDSGPTARFPFGKEALIPVVIAVQGMALVATLAYARSRGSSCHPRGRSRRHRGVSGGIRRCQRGGVDHHLALRPTSRPHI